MLPLIFQLAYLEGHRDGRLPDDLRALEQALWETQARAAHELRAEQLVAAPVGPRLRLSPLACRLPAR